mmetsp:Transcript_929/g.2083  ORF Transcript_929/g.2083 Transcript_929/m.2083 type:complete len:201 (-) Transcript_929:368-970(-)
MPRSLHPRGDRVRGDVHPPGPLLVRAPPDGQPGGQSHPRDRQGFRGCRRAGLGASGRPSPPADRRLRPRPGSLDAAPEHRGHGGHSCLGQGLGRPRHPTARVARDPVPDEYARFQLSLRDRFDPDEIVLHHGKGLPSGDGGATEEPGGGLPASGRPSSDRNIPCHHSSSGAGRIQCRHPYYGPNGITAGPIHMSRSTRAP